jgi:hypothetical protein
MMDDSEQLRNRSCCFKEVLSWRMIMQPGFAKEVLRRLPLAESVLVLWRWISDTAIVQEIFERCRGRCYEDQLAFSSLVHLVADALLEHRGSGRKSFERGRINGELNVSNVSAYGKLARLPQSVSEAFLAEGTDRLLTVFPRTAVAKLPESVGGFAVMVMDGKAIKRVPKRLRPLRKTKGGVLGGKALVALDLASGLAVAMATALDGDANDASLVPYLVPRMQQARPQPILWVADRQFCDLTQTRVCAEREGDHFLVRYHPRTKFFPAGSQPARTGQDSQGRTYEEQWGWLGVADNKARRYVRRITLKRAGEEPLFLITDLTDADRYPAVDLLMVYQMRWGIERVFQQITEVFELHHLIGTTPQGTLFQLAFCLLLYNLIQVIRAYVAEGAKEETPVVSTELLFDDVKRQMIALHETLEPVEIIGLVPKALTAQSVRKCLKAKLATVWTERWRKAPPKKRKPPEWKEGKRTHASAYRILMEDRLARNKKIHAAQRP